MPLVRVTFPDVAATGLIGLPPGRGEWPRRMTTDGPASETVGREQTGGAEPDSGTAFGTGHSNTTR